MKEFIIQVLDKVYNELVNNEPKTKTETKSKTISDLDLDQLQKLIKKFDIPDNARFSVTTDDITGYKECDIYWYEQVEKTEAERLWDIRAKFEHHAFVELTEVLFEHGYVSTNFPCNIQSTNAVFKWYTKHIINIKTCIL